MVTIGPAGRRARNFLVAGRATAGGYRISGWPELRPGRPKIRIDRAVARLRRAERAMLGFLDPVEDALFLTAGLRGLSFPASFHLGRELAPAVAPGGMYPWVQVGDEVVSTSLPVLDEYAEIFRTAGR
jgi:hypothetical protein